MFLVWSAGIGSDRWRFTLAFPLLVTCLLLAVFGLLLALWTVWVQFRHARGTPVPAMATKKLLTDRPYSLCRNPMALGTLMYYSGTVLYTRSFIPILVVMVFGLFLVSYIKLVEEKELFLKFGNDYLMYKRRTPLLMPRLRFHRRKSKP